MKESDDPSQFRRWLQYAQEDLDAATRSSESPDGIPRHVCWWAQQAAEKAIRSIFVFLEVPHPYQHDLKYLLTLLPDDWKVKHNHPEIARLTVWATAARYPADSDNPTTDDAARALDLASAIVNEVRAELIQHGAELE